MVNVRTLGSYSVEDKRLRLLVHENGSIYVATVYAFMYSYLPD
jgi:hypothetical protein